jgi:hypothetical protein
MKYLAQLFFLQCLLVLAMIQCGREAAQAPARQYTPSPSETCTPESTKAPKPEKTKHE